MRWDKKYNMTRREKIEKLNEEHFTEFIRTRREVFNQMSDAQSLFCVCKRLATGLHENSCKRFQDKVTTETIKRLKHLL